MQYYSKLVIDNIILYAFSDGDFLNALYFENNKKLSQHIAKATKHNSLPLFITLTQELCEYVLQERVSFAIPYQLMHGTDFQKTVWQHLAHVHYGKTTTYLQCAKTINKPTAVRAVANAISANPLPILLPCHRIIGSNGTLTGYAGGLTIKKQLLNWEAKK